MEKARIQIVEDEAIIAMELESQLQDLGYEVTSIVNTGESAILKAEEDKPDLITMDIRINGEMDGIDTAEAIRNRFGIPVIFSTAYLDQERIERAKITMPFGYVLKPIQERDLRVTIEMALYVSKVDQERRKSEEELKESEEKFRSVIENSLDLLYQFNLKTGTYDYMSPSIEKFVGITSEDYIKGGIELAISLLHPEDGEQLKNHTEHLLKGTLEDTFNPIIEYRFKNAVTNEWLWFSDNRKVILDEDNQPILIVGVSRDITDQKRAEEELRESEEKYRSVVKNANEAVFIVQDEIIRYSNPKTSEINEYTEEELNGMAISELVHPDDRQIVLQRNRQRQKGESIVDTYSQRIITKTGKIKWIEIKPIAFNWEHNPAVLVFASDITERKQAEEALVLSEEKYKNLAQNIPDILYELDQYGKITSINDSFYNYLGYDLNEITDQPFSKFIHPDDINKVSQSFLEAIETKRKRTKGLTFRLVSKDEKIYWFELNSTMEFDIDGNYFKENGIIRDITERKQAEEELKESEKRFKELADLLPQVIFEMDEKGLLIFVNKFAYEMFEYTEDDFKKGLNASQMLVPEEQEKAMINISRALDGEAIGGTEYMAQKKDGTKFPVILHSTRIMRGSDPVGLRGIIIDISDLKKS